MSATESSPSAKRRRTEPLDAPESSRERTRHAELWYEDGSVVLATEDTYFCVHRSVMSKHCIVWRDMFAMPQPETQEEYDGKPLIWMTDSTEDLVHFLHTLYDQL